MRILLRVLGIVAFWHLLTMGCAEDPDAYNGSNSDSDGDSDSDSDSDGDDDDDNNNNDDDNNDNDNGNDTNRYRECDYCHGQPPDQGSHRRDEHLKPCETCHVRVRTGTEPTHENDRIDMSLTDSEWDYTGMTCSISFDCHAGPSKVW